MDGEKLWTALRSRAHRHHAAYKLPHAVSTHHENQPSTATLRMASNNDQWPFSKEEWEAAATVLPQESRGGNTKAIITPEVVEMWKAHGLELSPTLVGGEKHYYEVLRPQLLKEHKGEHVAVSFDGSNAEVCFWNILLFYYLSRHFCLILLIKYYVRDSVAALKELLSSKFPTYWVTRIGEEISGGVGAFATTGHRRGREY